MGTSPVGPLNSNAWKSYLMRRGVSQEVAAKLANGDSVEIRGRNVTLTDGLDSTDEASLEMTSRTDDDKRVASGWNVDQGKDQTDGTKEIIDNDEVIRHEDTVRQYAAAHGIEDPEVAAKLYRAAPLGTENFAEVKANREKAQADLKGRYEAWKAGPGANRPDRSFSAFLLSIDPARAKYVQNTQIYQNKPADEKAYLRLIFASRFQGKDLNLQKDVLGVSIAITSTYSGGNDYEVENMLNWTLGKPTKAQANQGSAAKPGSTNQTNSDASSAGSPTVAGASAPPPPATPTLPAPPKEMKKVGTINAGKLCGLGERSGDAKCEIYKDKNNIRYVLVDSLYYQVDEKETRSQQDGSIAVDPNPKYQVGGIDQSAAASPPPPPVAATGQQPPAAQATDASKIPEPPKDMQKRTIKINNVDVNIYSSGGKSYLKTGNKYYEITNMNNYSGGLNTAEKPSFEDKSGDGPSQGGTNYMPQVGYQPPSYTGNVPGYRMPGQ